MIDPTLPKNVADYTLGQRKSTAEYCQKNFTIKELHKKMAIVDAQLEILKKQNRKEGREPYKPGPLNRRAWADLIVMRRIYEDAALRICAEHLAGEKKYEKAN